MSNSILKPWQLLVKRLTRIVISSLKHTGLPKLHPDCLAFGAPEQISFIQTSLAVFSMKSIYQFDKRFLTITDKLAAVGILIWFVESIAAYRTLHGYLPPHDHIVTAAFIQLIFSQCLSYYTKT